MRKAIRKWLHLMVEALQEVFVMLQTIIIHSCADLEDVNHRLETGWKGILQIGRASCRERVCVPV